MNILSNHSRVIAFELIRIVLKQHQNLDKVLEEHFRLNTLEKRDRSFIRHLATTTLRRLGQIDDLINQCIKHPLPRRATAARDVLRVGVCQLMFMNTPAHAAVNTTVSIVDNIKIQHYKKLINAVLRRIAREGQNLIQKQDAEYLNTPKWLWESWCKTYGEVSCRNIATTHLREPPLDISVKRDVKRWASCLNATVLATGTLRIKKTNNVTLLEGFDEGAWWIQDAAATLPVKLLGNVRGKHVIDLCAAPGGKTAQLINSGAKVSAVDRSAKRLYRLEKNLNRLKMKATTFCIDANKWKPKEKADFILLDAPCSSTGTIRRHPDILHLKKEEDISKLCKIQFQLLEAALGMLNPGGKIVYCTCSLQPQEGPEIIDRILETEPSLQLDRVNPEEINNLKELLTDEGTVRCLPYHLNKKGGMDGFFIARLICK